MDRFERLLQEAIRAVIEAKIAAVTFPSGLPDHDTYIYNLGYLKAFKDVSDICDQIREKLQ